MSEGMAVNPGETAGDTAVLLGYGEEALCTCLITFGNELYDLSCRPLESKRHAIEIADDLDALIVKLQRVQTELLSESPLNAFYGSVSGDLRSSPV